MEDETTTKQGTPSTTTSTSFRRGKRPRTGSNNSSRNNATASFSNVEEWKIVRRLMNALAPELEPRKEEEEAEEEKVELSSLERRWLARSAVCQLHSAVAWHAH